MNKKTLIGGLVIVLLIIIILIKNSNDTSIKQTTFKETAYIGIIKDLTLEEMKETSLYEESYGKIGAYMKENKIIPRGAPQSIYFSWDPEQEITKIGIAFPVRKGITVEDDELEYFEVEGGKVLSLLHMGDYSKLEVSHNKLMEYMEQNQLEMGDFAIEEYLTNPEKKEMSKWKTKLYYFLK